MRAISSLKRQVVEVVHLYGRALCTESASRSLAFLLVLKRLLLSPTTSTLGNGGLMRWSSVSELLWVCCPLEPIPSSPLYKRVLCEIHPLHPFAMQWTKKRPRKLMCFRGRIIQLQSVLILFDQSKHFRGMSAFVAVCSSPPLHLLQDRQFRAFKA